MPNHTIRVLPAAAAKETLFPAPPEWPKGTVRAGQGVFDAVTHRWNKSGPRNGLLAGPGVKPGELILYSPRCRARATVASRGDGLVIHELLPPVASPEDAILYIAGFKFLPNDGGAPADRLGDELLQLADPRALATPPPAPPAPPTPPPRVLRRLTDKELRPAASSLVDAAHSRLQDVPAATRRRFLPRSERAEVDEIQAVRDLVEHCGVKPLTFLPDALRPLVPVPAPDDLEIDARVRRALRTAMGIPLVNLLCSPAFGTQKLHQTLAALARLPLLEEDRAVLWLAMSRGVQPADRLSELEQIAKDLGPAADDPEHAALWESVVRMWLQEGLDGLLEDQVDMARQLRHLLEAKHASAAAFLTWRELRVHTRRRPIDESLLPAERLEDSWRSRPAGGIGLADIMRRVSTPVKIEPVVVKLKEKGADDEPPPSSAHPPPVQPAVPPSPPLEPPPPPEPPPPSVEVVPLRPRTLLELARHRLCRGVDETLAALTALRNAEARWAGAPLDAATLAGLGEALEQTLAALDEQRACLPKEEEVTGVAGAVDAITTSLGIGADTPLPEPLVDALAPADGLDRVRAACAIAERIEASLPDWVWGRAAERTARVAALAGEPASQDDLLTCLRWAEGLPPGPVCARDLADPGTGTLAERLRAAYEEQTRSRERDARLARIALITSDEARARIASGWPETEPEMRAREALRDRFEAVSGALSDNAREDLRTHLCGSSPEGAVDTVHRVERVRSKLDDISDLSFARILGIARLIPETVRPPATLIPNFSFGPPLSSKTSGGVHHARGVYQQIESLEYGIVRLPLRVSFEPALTAPIQLKIKLARTSGDFVTPGQLASYEAVPPLDLPPGINQHDFEIAVVLSRRFAEDLAAGKRKNLEVVVEGTGPGGKSCKTTLTWTALAMMMPELRDPIPQTVEPEEMLLCPLGVECHYDELLTHVRQGASSFFVYGPRRFGKTSLLRAVDKFVGAGDVVLLRPVVASMRTLPALWNDIAEKFHEKLGPARAHTTLEDGLLPVDYAYDAIREAAAERGIRAIYVLVDEAQAMFAHPRRVELAERLKERMEHAWMAVRQNGKLKRAAVLFGLIGQGHLRRLFTPNLRASLKEYERFEFSDEEILNLLRRTTGADGLQSTKDAREHLAKLAGNLFILSKLLTEIRSLCTKSQRTWFLRADVDRASAKLEAAFRDGEGAIWDWVRDPLNESDDRNDWRPSIAYPLALAWAGARARGEGGRAGAVALLRKLCPEAEPLEDRVDEVVEELRDLRVLDANKGEFKLPMLERLLAIRAESPRPLDDAEQEAAQRLGLRRVRRPPPERSEADDPSTFEGGQARIWRANWNGRTAAVRAISLSDKTRSRARFIHEVALLRKVGEAGDQRVQLHLPRIFEMGIADDDPSQGLVIYEWIPGYPLPEASMTEPAVAEVGLQMADVLEVLERSGVVHRDIRPANVLLRVPTDGQANRAEIDVVLIDFGLARAVEHLRGGQRSIVEGVAEFLPPEVYGTSDSSAWSTAGDVYSTGIMLQKLLRQPAAADGAASSRHLRELLAGMTAHRPEDRPTAAGIRERFHAVMKSLEGESKSTGLAELEAAIRNRVAKLPDPMQVSALDCLRSLVFIQAGMLNGVRRYAAVAAMLECAFRRVLRPRLPPRNSPPPTYLRTARTMLSEAGIDVPAWLDDRRMAAAGLLRNADHHPDDFNAIAHRALGLLGTSLSARDADGRLVDALTHAARLVDELTQSSLVAPFVGEVLRTGAPNGAPTHGQTLRLT